MTVRNLSPQQMFIRLAEEHVPEYRFKGKTKSQFNRWKRQAEPKVLARLGDFPDPVAPRPKMLVEWEEKGLRRQRWIVDVQQHIAATLLVNYPSDMKRGEQRPAPAPPGRSRGPAAVRRKRGAASRPGGRAGSSGSPKRKRPRP